jgi:hypothetical protein
LASPEFLIASEHETNLSGRDLLDPAVAYNADDEQYAVVYLTGDSNSNDRWTLNGQLISAGPSNPNVLTDVNDGFEIAPFSFTLQPNHPDVAWSLKGNAFLVVYEEQFPTNVDKIVGRYLYDTYQGGGTQVRGTGGFIIAPIFAMDNTQDVDEYNHPSVAYDPLSGYYLASFEHSQTSGSSTSTRIYGYRIEGEYPGGPGTVGDPIPIETQIDSKFISHDSPHAAYSGADGEVYVTYRTNYEENGKTYYHIYNRTVRGKSVRPRLRIQTSIPNEFLSEPEAAGTKDGRAMVVWHNQLFDEPYTMEVFGQRLKPLLKLYIPIVLEK